MKKITFVLVLFCLVVSSCTKNVMDDNSKDSSQKDVHEIISLFNSDYAVFENDHQLNQFLVAYSKLEYHEKEDLVRTLPYSTMQELIDDSYERMIEASNEDEFEQIVQNTNGALEIKLNQENEKEVYETGVINDILLPFLNEDMIIKVGDQFYKYFNVYRIMDENYTFLESIRDLDAIDISSSKTEKVYRIVDSDVGEIKQRWGDVNQDFTDEEVLDLPGCVNDRKVTYKAVISEIEGLDDFFYSAGVTLRAKRKGILCIWYNYRTEIQMRDFRHAFRYTYWDRVPARVYWPENDAVVENAYKISRSYYIHDGAYLNGFDAEWNLRHVETTTSELDPQWLIVDFSL